MMMIIIIIIIIMCLRRRYALIHTVGCNVAAPKQACVLRYGSRTTCACLQRAVNRSTVGQCRTDRRAAVSEFSSWLHNYQPVS
jgi:hypothetical protein